MKICAPFAGIVHYHVAVGDIMETGQQLASVEAVKLEAPLFAPGPGRVEALLAPEQSDVAGGDELVTLGEV